MILVGRESKWRAVIAGQRLLYLTQRRKGAETQIRPECGEREVVERVVMHGE
jgi:hypothetical protein